MKVNTVNNVMSFGAKPFTKKDETDLINAYYNNALVAFDIDTQDDFMRLHENPRDGLYVNNAESIIGNLGKITNLVDEFAIPKIETMDTHTPDDPEFKIFIAGSDKHCVRGTKGWQKIAETISSIAPKVIDVNPKVKDGLSRKEVEKFIYNNDVLAIYKNTYDLTKTADEKGVFHDNKKTKSLLKNLKAEGIKIALVYGVATDFCVKAAVDALKKIGIKPIVVEDAVKHVAEDGIANPNDKTYGDVTVMTTKQLQETIE